MFLSARPRGRPLFDNDIVKSRTPFRGRAQEDGCPRRRRGGKKREKAGGKCRPVNQLKSLIGSDKNRQNRLPRLSLAFPGFPRFSRWILLRALSAFANAPRAFLKSPVLKNARRDRTPALRRPAQEVTRIADLRDKVLKSLNPRFLLSSVKTQMALNWSR